MLEWIQDSEVGCENSGTKIFKRASGGKMVGPI
jgi:hypothetical protein